MNAQYLLSDREEGILLGEKKEGGRRSKSSTYNVKWPLAKGK